MSVVYYYPCGESVTQWFVQLTHLSMVASSNDRWQDIKIKQCKLEGGGWYVNL